MIKETRVENGLLRGIAAADPRIITYKGVPFAAPPVGNLRWHEPVACPDWEGVRDCSRFAPISMQGKPGTQHNIYELEWNVDSEIPMSEDCLYLNIWTPAKTTEERLPVFVWFFGGAYQEGNTAEMEFNGERIARRGIVVVTVNYRVNCFGFLAHPEITKENPEAPANFGLLDQFFGVQWVHKNISEFGGDPDNITIGGQSAGGGSVISQITSPKTKGYYKGAVIMSGTFYGAYGPMGTRPVNGLEAAEKQGEDFFDFLGVKTLAEARALDAFYVRDKYAEYIGGVVDTTALNRGRAGARIGPCTDGKFITGNGVQMMINNERQMIPLIMGNTPIEFPAVPFFKDEAEFEEYVKATYGDSADKFISLVKGSNWSETQKNATFAQIELGARLIATASAACKDAPNTYYYQFDPSVPGPDAPGPFHSCDLWFWFESLASCWRPYNGKHYDLARHMCNYLCNFIKSGDPNGNDADGTDMPAWLPYAECESPMYFNEDCAGMKDRSSESDLMKLMVDFNLNK